MNRILISGICGFIGSNLALALQEKYPNAEIIGYDFLLSGDVKNLLGFNGEVVDDLKSLYGKEIDIIFHLGALTDTTNSSLRQQMHYNVEISREFLPLKSKTFIYASSASVYGMGATKPSKETDELKPANSYAISKSLLEVVMAKYKPDSIGFRFFNVFGPKEQHKGHAASMVTQICKKVKNGENVNLFPDGEQRRDFIYVKDVIDLLIEAANYPVPGIYNCGFGQSKSFNEVFKMAKSIYPDSKSEINWIDNKFDFFQEFTEASLDKTIGTFNWFPKWDLSKAMNDYKDSL